jgi:hypothetical protein
MQAAEEAGGVQSRERAELQRGFPRNSNSNGNCSRGRTRTSSDPICDEPTASRRMQMGVIGETATLRCNANVVWPAESFKLD